MNEPPLDIRVDQLPPNGQFVWVVLETRSSTETVELGASLEIYDDPEVARLAGESALDLLDLSQ